MQRRQAYQELELPGNGFMARLNWSAPSRRSPINLAVRPPHFNLSCPFTARSSSDRVQKMAAAKAGYIRPLWWRGRFPIHPDRFTIDAAAFRPLAGPAAAAPLLEQVPPAGPACQDSSPVPSPTALLRPVPSPVQPSPAQARLRQRHWIRSGGMLGSHDAVDRSPYFRSYVPRCVQRSLTIGGVVLG